MFCSHRKLHSVLTFIFISTCARLSPKCVLSYNQWTREGGQNVTPTHSHTCTHAQGRGWDPLRWMAPGVRSYYPRNASAASNKVKLIISHVLPLLRVVIVVVIATIFIVFFSTRSWNKCQKSKAAKVFLQAGGKHFVVFLLAVSNACESSCSVRGPKVFHMKNYTGEW